MSGGFKASLIGLYCPAALPWQSCESSVVILLLPNGDVSAAPTQGGSAASTRLLRVVSQHQKLSFMIMKWMRVPETLFTLRFTWVV